MNTSRSMSRVRVRYAETDTMEVVYKQPARYDDELDVRTGGDLISPIRVQFTYEIVRPGDTALIATGHTVHASLDRAGRPRRLPDRIQAIFPCKR